MLLNKTTTDADDKVTSSAVLTDEPKKKNLKYYLKVAGPPAVVFYFGVYCAGIELHFLGTVSLSEPSMPC